MRRLLKITVALIVAGAAALVIVTVAQGSDTYNFDVIFDDGRGLVSGQEVKIAGAAAGEISNVTVTSDYKARVEATIKGPFHFHSDATCIIRPDGLIAENYLNCNPGTASKPLLQGKNGLPPTVPVSQTSEPVNLQDLFNIFNLPTRERFQVLINELGIATAGNGNEINSILRRANPTLQAAQRVIKVLDGQTTEISTAITATDQIAREGATHTTQIQNFLQQASGLTQLTADHSSSLEQAINKLPAFLAASTPALKELNTVADTGTPLLANLRAATPSLNKVDRDIVPFTSLATPALSSLSTAVSAVIPAAKKVTPLVATISNYLQASKGTTANFAKLIDNLIQHGFSENFLSVLYYVATSLGKYDQNSHMLSSLLLFPGNGLCASYATTPSTNPDCNAHYGAASAYMPARRAQRTAGSKGRSAKSGSSGASGSTGAGTSAGSGASTGSAGASGTPSLGGGVSNGLQNLGSTVSGGVSSVLSGVGNTVGGITSGLTGTTSTTGTSSTPAPDTTSTTSSNTSTTGSLSNLLNYLLK